jgi:xyloglucan-specific endo-beta-1,4-glucanase
MVCNVAYDIFLDATASNPTSAYEMMIWLGSYGGGTTARSLAYGTRANRVPGIAGPIGSQVATVTIAGTNWKLFDGYNGSMRVFSFVAPSTVTNFNGDAKLFLNHLVSNYGLSTNLYVNSKWILKGGGGRRKRDGY